MGAGAAVTAIAAAPYPSIAPTREAHMRETAAQKKTRISMLLADYDAKNREFNKLKKDVDALKAQVKDIPAGTYGEWIRAHGTPRQINDIGRAREIIAEIGRVWPMRESESPIIVTHNPK